MGSAAETPLPSPWPAKSYQIGRFHGKIRIVRPPSSIPRQPHRQATAQRIGKD